MVDKIKSHKTLIFLTLFFLGLLFLNISLIMKDKALAIDQCPVGPTYTTEVEVNCKGEFTEVGETGCDNTTNPHIKNLGDSNGIPFGSEYFCFLTKVSFNNADSDNSGFEGEWPTCQLYLEDNTWRLAAYASWDPVNPNHDDAGARCKARCILFKPEEKF